MACHVTPHSASAAVLRGAGRSPTHDPWRQKASERTPSNRQLDRRWWGAHGSTTRAPFPLKRTADLVTERSGPRRELAWRRAVGEKSRRNGTTNWWRRRAACGPRTCPRIAPTVGSAPGPRARARRDARPATCHAGPRAPSAVKRVSRHRVWGPRPARGGDSGSTVTSRGGGRGTSRQGRARGLVGRTTGTRGRARVVRFDRRRSGERARSDGECGQKLCLAGGEMKR